MKTLRGYDIDGVLARPGKKPVDPIQPYVVISGRTFHEYDYVCKAMARYAPVYIRGTGKFGDAEAAGQFKARMIQLLGVTEFYEDDPRQAEIIEESCPLVKVILVK